MKVDFSVVPVCVENEIKTEIKEETQKNSPLKQESVYIVKKILEDRAAKNKPTLTNQEISTRESMSGVRGRKTLSGLHSLGSLI